jgi:putative oxidoreductase
MIDFFSYIFGSASSQYVEMAIAFMRVGIGVLTIFHGVPKIMGGVAMWKELGAFMHPLGIYFLPIMWGFLGAATEFFGGIALVLGLGTRIASVCLVIMMIVAFAWHLDRGDSYQVYSFPLSLIVVFLAFIVIGDGMYSLQHYFFQ